MKLLLFDDMSQCTENEVQRLLPLVSVQRREQAMRFKHLFGRFACLKSYEMLKHCVADTLADETEDASLKERLRRWNGLFVYNEHGKPFMQDRYHGKKINAVDFSISHCKHAIAVALNSTAVGVDVESFRQAEDSLLRKTMNDEEIATVVRSDNPAREFTRLWTQKEALLKMQGTGLVDELPELLTASEVFSTSRVQTIVNEEHLYVCTLIL